MLAERPRAVVYGVIFGTVVDVIFDGYMAFAAAMSAVWEGSSRGFTPQDDTIGIIDIPRFLVGAFLMAIDPLATAVLDAISYANAEIVGFAEMGFVGAVVALAVTAFLFGILGRAVFALAGDVPGVGALFSFLGLD